MNKCEFPGCDFISKYPNDFHYHHIVPQELKGSNKYFNLIHICQHCHNKIYVEGSHKCSKHHILRDDSITCDSIQHSTGGLILNYTILSTGEQKIHLLDTWREGNK